MFEPEQVGALAPENRPQSSTLRSSWPSSPSVSILFEVASVNVPETLPELAMSTVPLTLSPGFMFGAVNSALDEVLPIVRVPAVKVLDGFAACAVKFAPEPTVMPTAARTTARALMVRRGCAARADRRDTETASEEGGNGTHRRRCLAGSDPSGFTAGRCRGSESVSAGDAANLSRSYRFLAASGGAALSALRPRTPASPAPNPRRRPGPRTSRPSATAAHTSCASPRCRSRAGRG